MRHWKLKITSTFKQTYNLKFREFKTIRTLKVSKRPNLDQSKSLKLTIIRAEQKKRGKKKRKKVGRIIFNVVRCG